MNVRGFLTTGLIALVVTVAYSKYGAGVGMRKGA